MVLKGNNQSDFLSPQTLKLRRWTLFGAMIYACYSSLLDFFRYSAAVFKVTIPLKVMLVLLPLLVVLWLFKNKSELSRGQQNAILVFLVLAAGLAHSLVYYFAVSSGFYTPNAGLLIILMYAGLFLALPIITGSICCVLIIVMGAIGYLCAGDPLNHVVVNTNIYVLFSIGCLSVNKVCFRILSNNYQLMRMIEKQSTTDELTALFNRRYFYKQANLLLNQANRNKSSVAVAIVDLDNFKQVNDKFGHVTGDNVLQGVSKILEQSCRRPFDFVSRVGGDEFVLILYETNREHLTGLCEKIIAEIADVPVGVNLNNEVVDFGCSIGAVLSLEAENHQELEIDHLYEFADRALYLVKNKGKNGFQIYNNESCPQMKV